MIFRKNVQESRNNNKELGEQMIIQCPACQKKYQLPAGAAPENKKFSITCPGCKQGFIVDPASDNDKKNNEENSSPPRGNDLKKTILENVKALPPVPEILAKARVVINDPNSSAEDIARLIEADPAMATRVLKLSNSAYYNLLRPVSSIRHACMILGQANLLGLITVVSTSRMLSKKLEGYGLDSGALLKHSLAVAVCAQIIAKRKAPDLENDAFTAGLLHDSGKIILDEYINKVKNDFHAKITDGNMTYLKAEQTILGFDHASIAYDFFKLWNIPEIQAHAIKFHHYPTLSGQNELAYILHISDYIAKKAGFATMSTERELYPVENATLEVLDLCHDDIRELEERTTEAANAIFSGLS